MTPPVPRIPAQWYAGARSAVQLVISAVLAKLTFLAPLLGLLGLDASDPGALAELATAAAIAALFGLYVTLVRWLETRTGDAWPARVARGVAKVMMLALDRFQPVYGQADPSTTAQAIARQRADNVSPTVRGVPTIAAVLRE